MHGPSGAAIWSSPTIDEKAGAIYVATGDSYSDPAAKTSDAIVALDLKTGVIRWSQQMTANDAYNIACGMPDPVNCPEAKGPDHDFGSPPILVGPIQGNARWSSARSPPSCMRWILTTTAACCGASYRARRPAWRCRVGLGC